MLTASEKRFIKSWEEQRKGGRFKYYALYVLAGTFVATLILSFLAQIFGLDLVKNFLFILVGSFILVAIGTVASWKHYENKFKGIIQREVRDAIKREGL